MDPEKTSLNFIFPTKYVIPKSLKFSHWPSKFLKNLTDSQQVFGVFGMLQLPGASLASQKHLNNLKLAIRKAAEMPKPRKNGIKKHPVLRFNSQIHEIFSRFFHGKLLQVGGKLIHLRKAFKIIRLTIPHMLTKLNKIYISDIYLIPAG